MVRRLRGGVPLNPKLVAEFTGLPRCEYCDARCHDGTHAHHVVSRGAGGPDLAINLIALGGPSDCNCHGLYHSGHILQCDLLAVVAAREGTTQDAIRAEIDRMRRDRP
jgi:hypothetical protein